MENFNYLGKKVSAPSKQLDTFEKPNDVQTVKFESSELTSYCPVTHQPDFYTVIIEFTPDKLCIELKSLKLYFNSYRNDGLFFESATNKILDDLVAVCKPRYMLITAEFNVRGGISSVIEAEYYSDKFNK